MKQRSREEDKDANNNGNVLSLTISAAGFTATQAYGYDGVNRLETSAEGTLWSRNHGYDQYGNGWVTVNTNLPLSGMTPVAQSWFNAANNQIVGYAYEPSGTGNLTGANGWTYTYDGENRLKQAQTTINGTTYTDTYEYDGEGRRVKKTVSGSSTVTTHYVYDALGQMIAEYTDDTAPQTAGTQYLMADHLGSTRAVLDVSTDILSCHDYLPFGEELTAGRESAACYNNADSVKQKFTGKERDVETGLDYFGARYFSGPQGRFTGTDPKFPSGKHLVNPQKWNKYVCTLNNPLRYFDPDGLEEIDVQLRAFIPQKSVTVAGKTYAGDNRAFSTAASASYRTTISVRIETDPAKRADPIISATPGTAGLTRRLDEKGHTVEAGVATVGLPTVTGARDANGGVVLSFREDAKIPLSPGPQAATPGISADLNILIPQTGSSVTAVGTTSPFPAIELNVTPEGQPTTNVVLNDPGPNGTPWSLLFSGPNYVFASVPLPPPPPNCTSGSKEKSCGQ